jgi:hypothetical protein
VMPLLAETWIQSQRSPLEVCGFQNNTDVLFLCLFLFSSASCQRLLPVRTCHCSWGVPAWYHKPWPQSGLLFWLDACLHSEEGSFKKEA